MPLPQKDQTDKLTLQQQHALADLNLAELRKRERLLRMASSYRGRRWLTLVSFILAAWAAFVNLSFTYKPVGIAILGIVFALLHVHVHGINKRLDGLIQLLDSDRKRDDNEQSSRDDANS